MIKVKAEIQSIYTEHKGNYGYRRMTLELRNRGFVVNHKKVQRFDERTWFNSSNSAVNGSILHTKEMLVKKADNLIQRQFEAPKPMEKCYTDVTEFAIPARRRKLFLLLVY